MFSLRFFFVLSLGDSLWFIFFKMILPLVIVVAIITIINIIYNYLKYGSKLLSVFKKKKVINYEVGIIVNNIKSISGYRKMINLTNYQSDILIIDEQGFFLILYYNQGGTLMGRTNDECLKLKKGIDVFTSVPNPYRILRNDEQKLLDILGEVEIKKIIVFNNNCNVQVERESNIKTVFLRNISHVFKNELKSNTKEKLDVDKYYKKFLSSL